LTERLQGTIKEDLRLAFFVADDVLVTPRDEFGELFPPRHGAVFGCFRFRLAGSSALRMSTPTGDAIHPSRRTPDLNAAEQRATITKITWRLLPLLLFCYIIAYIDRINVGFAKLHLREVLGVSEDRFSSAYGLGAGLFFIGYFLFEVPSNLILQRVGARVWIARIMIVWGLVSMSFMFLKGTTMFYTLRFLLGAAEAGFFPGVILYLTYWFPARERARTVAMFVVGGVLAGVIGSPISGALLQLDGFGGLAGWQWLFLLEGIPAVIMGLVVLLVLPNRPQAARWLSPAQKDWIQGRLADDVAPSGPAPRHGLIAIFTNGRVWLLCLIYFLLNVGGYGYELWLPSIIRSFSTTSSFVLGTINAIPYFAAGVVMLLVARYSDKTGERRGVVALAAISSAIGFALSAWFKNPYLAMAALSLAFIGLKSTIAPFWAMTTAFLGGTAAAAGIAFINSVGNLGGFAGPYLVGVIKDRTGSNVAALLLLGAALLGMAVFTLALPKTPRPRGTIGGNK
jgi:MFS transporter, ACS family, tartrate transporter